MPPIKGFYRYHVIYLVISAVLIWVFYPEQVYASFGLMGLLCLLGLLFLLMDQYLLSQVVAVAVGFAAPIILFAQLTPLYALALFLFLLMGGYVARNVLFFP